MTPVGDGGAAVNEAALVAEVSPMPPLVGSRVLCDVALTGAVAFHEIDVHVTSQVAGEGDPSRATTTATVVLAVRSAACDFHHGDG